MQFMLTRSSHGEGTEFVSIQDVRHKLPRGNVDPVKKYTAYSYHIENKLYSYYVLSTELLN